MQGRWRLNQARWHPSSRRSLRCLATDVPAIQLAPLTATERPARAWVVGSIGLGCVGLGCTLSLDADGLSFAALSAWSFELAAGRYQRNRAAEIREVWDEASERRCERPPTLGSGHLACPSRRATDGARAAGQVLVQRAHRGAQPGEAGPRRCS
jgi:hypothetical protein